MAKTLNRVRFNKDLRVHNKKLTGYLMVYQNDEYKGIIMAK